jgi:protein-tyrosine phosphatase
MINFGCIEPEIFLGSAPQTSVDVSRLKQMKITAVLSLQSDNDFVTHRINWKKLQSAYQYNDISVHRFPIIDFDERDLGDKLAVPIKALQSLLAVSHRVYVHCNAGVCRAPATVLGFLCHARGMTLEQGLDYIRQNRPQANPYKSAVLRALQQLAEETS